MDYARDTLHPGIHLHETKILKLIPLSVPKAEVVLGNIPLLSGSVSERGGKIYVSEMRQPSGLYFKGILRKAI